MKREKTGKSKRKARIKAFLFLPVFYYHKAKPFYMPFKKDIFQRVNHYSIRV